MIQVLISLNLLKSLITSVQCVKKLLKSGLMNTKVLGVNIRHFVIRFLVECLVTLYPSLKEMGQEDKYEQVSRGSAKMYVKILVSHHLVTPFFTDRWYTGRA